MRTNVIGAAWFHGHRMSIIASDQCGSALNLSSQLCLYLLDIFAGKYWSNMACCSINSSKKSVLQVFRFPLGDRDRLDQWTLNTRRQSWTPNKTTHLCSEHFESHHFSTDSRIKTPFSYSTSQRIKKLIS